jgi:hypothetical protein
MFFAPGARDPSWEGAASGDLCALDTPNGINRLASPGDRHSQP